MTCIGTPVGLARSWCLLDWKVRRIGKASGSVGVAENIPWERNTEWSDADGKGDENRRNYRRYFEFQTPDFLGLNMQICSFPFSVHLPHLHSRMGKDSNKREWWVVRPIKSSRYRNSVKMWRGRTWEVMKNIRRKFNSERGLLLL